MVHKKSEYRLNYKWLPANIKRDLLQVSANNLDYRMLRRQRDLSHHPWEWHCVDDSCECDEADEGDRFLPLPPLRQKHNMLLDEWNRKEHPVPRVATEKVTPNISLRSNKEQAIPNVTTNRSIDEARFSPFRIDAAVVAGEREQKNRLENVINGSPDVLEKPHIEKSQSHRIKDYCHVTNRGQAGGHRLQAGSSERGMREVTNARRMRTDVVPALPKSTLIDYHRPVSVGKGKDAVAEKKPPFVTYGWANSVKEMGKQQTHNIRVKSDEVHPSALLAKKIRSELSQPNLVNFPSRKCKSISNLATISCPLLHDASPWTTEYQRNFSNKRSVGD